MTATFKGGKIYLLLEHVLHSSTPFLSHPSEILFDGVKPECNTRFILKVFKEVLEFIFISHCVSSLPSD